MGTDAGGNSGENAGAEALKLNFGKRLAHTDKTVRDKGFKNLRKWLQKHTDLNQLDYMKLWKALFFAMWMSDKRPVQQELCVHIALLVNDVPLDKQIMWLDCFWVTMEASYENLDKHRLSKYLLFLRIVVAEAFKCLRVRGWKKEEAKALGQVFVRSVPEGKAKKTVNLHSQALLNQLTRVFWSELRPQLGWEEGAALDPAPSNAIMELLDPLLGFAASSGAEALTSAIHSNVLRVAPKELKALLVERVLAGAARSDIPGHNREALYETADILESTPAQAAAAATRKRVLRKPAGSADVKKPARKKIKKDKTVKEGGMSPLLLPRAVTPEECDPPRKKRKKAAA